ncbi:hypothetical protein VF14_13635 [Nostoc linckia z18]|uniref:Serine protease n=2 Tax=Nostoc linckia TaxID=92942 RepID=A0A9Q5ZC39_NOSLI|nr:endonuclease [Nostoc linckia]PHK42245.1 hypothetical protein VF12_03525 [Nostoc linckia z15]PHK45453.1 hypothetical protein VF13_15980 [Nostoc linckia z16]PHJ59030.1 hypothetical protein VF02_25960 [Nostoc linckia z1]PHJ61883.1 hypothetical protein VF05_27660 [Nostoc linckia z3]PHJ67800.1 hypothetical protein VF03_25410 [Nostoc linckia z2]
MVIPKKLLEETEQRYAERTEIREDTKHKLASGSPIQADEPQRVQKRLRRLASHVVNIEVPSTEGVTTVVRTTDISTLERIINQSDLMSISFLEEGLLVARSVGHIGFRSMTGRRSLGTGFMVSPRLLLTNNHVLPDVGQATRCQVEFNYQNSIDNQSLPSVIFDLQPDVFFLTDEGLDYSLVAVAERAVNGDTLSSFGWLPLIEEEGKILKGEYASIIQHPNGEPKQLALRENQIVDLLEKFLHYETDTAPGSSGSPVFSDQWEVVALHHSGVPRRDRQRRILAKDGTLWRPEQGEDKIDWIANEGVRISRIVRHIRQQNLPSAQQHLREQLFNTPPRLERNSVQSPSMFTATQQPSINPDGSAAWTLPLQVSVRLGQLTLPNGINDLQISSNRTQPLDNGIFTVNGNRSVNGQTRSLEENPELQAALSELERGRSREYYNEGQDRQNREEYYSNLPDSLNRTKLFNNLSNLLQRTHTTCLEYKPSTHLYPFVDLRPGNLKLQSIYSGNEFEPEEFIREAFQIEELIRRFQESITTESAINEEHRAAQLDLLEASMPFNCEHVVPQSWFTRREPMRGDLHHLFACEPDCNSFRGNVPFFDFPDFGERIRDKCGKREEKKFEPSAGKGAVARATLYFLLRYPGEINRSELEENRLITLLNWHENEPPNEYEKHRNMAIFEKQGNRNPLIDFPDWADRIEWRLGLS